VKVRFQADANLDPDIGLGLQRRDLFLDYCDASGIIPDGMPDPEVLALAADEGRVLVTNDLRMPKHFAEFIAIRDSPGVLLRSFSLVDQRND
jgi:predicted nuclease of predicted toxin-antitoxin system